MITDTWSRIEPELKALAKSMLGEGDTAHDFGHVEKVVANAKTIAQEIPCRLDVVIAAAYLHDIVPRRHGMAFSAAAEASAEFAGAQLTRLGFSCSDVADVQSCIATASWEFAARGGMPASVEAHVLRDADLLEAIGAHGIARVFAFAGAFGLSLSWVETDVRCPQRLKPNIDSADPPFHHFYSKLLWVNELFYSNTAKQEGERRRACMLRYLEEYVREREWARPPPSTVA